MSMRQFVDSNREAQLIQSVPIPSIVATTGAMMENEEVVKQDFENWLDSLDPVPYSRPGGYEQFWADVDDFLDQYLTPEEYYDEQGIGAGGFGA